MGFFPLTELERDRGQLSAAPHLPARPLASGLRNFAWFRVIVFPLSDLSGSASAWRYMSKVVSAVRR